MDLDRPHHRNTNSSELFICFTSRLSSSSSMKLYKSILSPGRSRDQPMSLPTSLSRRLRTNGSIKGGQASPMFPSTTATTKKRGCAFENPEPSSPKVTCIGQVRVKTKKKAAAAKKHTRSLSRRRSGRSGSGGGEVSFRKKEDGLSLKCEDNKSGSFGQGSQRYTNPHSQQPQECLPHRNQRWVHLPVTICEALRAFGAEFSCLFPCKSWCSTSERENREDKGNGHLRDGAEQSSCGAVFARWLVTLQDEGGKGREVEFVVGEEDEGTSPRMSTRTSNTRRRHVLEDFEVNSEIFDAKVQQSGGHSGDEQAKYEEPRVSICIPPKNALLLMRCRSDPVKMAALTSRCWEVPPVTQVEQNEDDDGDGDADSRQMEQLDVQECEDRDELEVKGGMVEEKHQDNEHVEIESDFEMEEKMSGNDEKVEILEEKPASNEQSAAEEDEEMAQFVQEEEEFEADSVEDKQVQENQEEESRTSCSSTSSGGEELEAARAVLLAIETALQEDVNAEIAAETEPSGQETKSQISPGAENSENTHEKEEVNDPGSDLEELRDHKEREEDQEKDKEASKLSSSVLPDCLLLMMCEPKLSMEVSKETWVCRTDFIRCLPQRYNNSKQVNPLAESATTSAAKNGDNVDDNIATSNEAAKKRVSIDSNSETNSSQNLLLHQPPQLAVPPRSSCSLPAAAAVSMATMIEQKLVNAVGYEPFVLTRCKSEPMRTAAKLAAPDVSCFWTKRKLEPLRRAAYQVGAAGVGF